MQQPLLWLLAVLAGRAESVLVDSAMAITAAAIVMP
jgi:hypothetical protein